MPSPFLRRLLAPALLASLLPAPWCAAAEPAEAASWPRFRGPNGAGVGPHSPVPSQWTAEQVRWQTELPGEGHSSAVIWGERVFTTAAREEEGRRWLLCYNAADGAELWRAENRFQRHPKHKVNSFATSTPALDAEQVYALWQAKEGSTLSAHTHAGELRWEVELGGFKGGHGTGVSPIVVGSYVVVCNDQDGESYVAAIDRASGEVAWKTPRASDRACYATPCLYEPAGGAPQLIVVHSFLGITGLELASGRELWSIAPFGTHQQRACASPIVHGELVIGTSGFATSEKNTVAVRPGDSGKVEEVYRVTRTAPHCPSPLIHGDRLYLWTDKGIVTCCEAATGREIWTRRAGGNYFASPICLGDRLFNIDVDGQVVVLAAADEFQELGRNPLGEASNATLAAAAGRLYARTLTHLACVVGGE